MDFFISAVYRFTYPFRVFYRWIGYWTPGLSRLPSVSPAMRMALMVLFFLLMIWSAAFVKNAFWSTEKAALDWKLWTFGALPFVVLIPVIVYWLVRFWMIRESSRFPEIDRIWEDGLAECEKNGISINEVPLFLVLGNPDLRRANQLVRAAHLGFTVAVPDSGPAPISFFANREAAFLFLDGCSCLSLLAAGGASAAGSAPAGGPAPGENPVAGMATLDPFAKPAGQQAGQAPPVTTPVMQTLTDSSIRPASGPPTTAAASPGSTLQLPDGVTAADLIQRASATRGAAQRGGVPQASSQDLFIREQRLKHACQLVVRARQTLCPINGLLSLLPFELIENASGSAQSAAQKDLAVLRSVLQVRCANTVVVTEMEKEEGFQELINRVGAERARENRFGKGCELWAAPEANRLRAVAVHAAGAFEDWIYMLFQEADALKLPNNSRLFRLLCRVRGRFSENLQNVLGQGFGFDPRTEPELAHEQFLYGGCYFAAAGGRPGQHAFVKSVFQKMLQQEGELEWAPAARRIDGQYQLVANLFALVGTLAFFGTAAMIVYRIWFSTPEGGG